MKNRKIRKELHVSVEMSEGESVLVRTFLWNIPGKFYDEIAKIAEISDQEIANVKGAIEDLCYELEIHPGEYNDNNESDS